MEGSLIIVKQVIALFVAILAGFIARKKSILRDEVLGGVNALLMDISMPCLAFASFQFEFSSEILQNILIMMAGAFLLHLVLTPLSRLIFFHYKDRQLQVLRFTAIFSNAGFMGLPLISALLGQEGVLYCSVFLVAFNVFNWTIGVWLYTGKGGIRLRTLITCPSLVAVFLGFFFFLLRIPLWEPLSSGISLVGSLTTPLSMIIIGARMADMKLKEVVGDASMYYAAFVRLILIPLAVYGVTTMIGLDGVVRTVLLLCSAMPAAAATTLFAERYGGDGSYAAKVVFFTTLLSLVTIPAILLLVG